MTAVLPPRTDTYNPTAVRNWLRLIHNQSTGWVWIGSTRDRFRGRTFEAAHPHWVEQAARYVDQLDQAGAAGIYLRTTTLRARPEKRGSDHDSLALPGLAADLDIAGPGHKTTKPLPPDADAAERVVDEAGLLQPSLWVHSGGGLYAWWLLDQPHTITDTARAIRFSVRWQDVLVSAAGRLGWHYGNVGDLSRILRIPGTINRKPAMLEPRPCRIVRDTGIRYALTDLRGNLHDAVAALPAPAPTPIWQPRPRPADGLAPGDAYEASVDWTDILLPHGWTLAYAHGRVRYWRRPGKERHEGHSASTGKASDRDRIYVFSDATELPSGVPLTKFAAYCHLEHGGNYSAGARELRRLGYGTQREVAA